MNQARTTGSPSGEGVSSPDGLRVVDKPSGWTSHDVVARARRLLRTKKVGHAGTLDPMATGVLVLGVGRSTKLLTYVVGADKTYLATIRLGQDTVTDDAEGEVTASLGVTDDVAPDRIESALARLRGDILQVPSAVSAIKVAGRRSYARVRAGEDVVLPSRPVTVSLLRVLATRRAVAPDGTAVLDLDVEVTCSSGTYVRALARDLGADLGTGGHLTALRRTRVGGYGLDVARDLDELTALVADGGTPELLSPAAAAAGVMPVRQVDAAEQAELRFGRWLAPNDRPGPVAAVSVDGDLLAVLEDTTRRGELLARPVVVHAI